MDISDKIKQVYNELRNSTLVLGHICNDETLGEFSNILNTLTVAECELFTKLHDNNNKAFKETIKPGFEHLITPTSSLIYNLRIADLVDIKIGDTFLVCQSDGFMLPKKFVKPAVSTEKKPSIVKNPTYGGKKLPPMGKGKYDKETRQAHKIAKQLFNGKQDSYPADMSFANLGSWDEIE